MQHYFDINIAMKYGIQPAIILNNLYFWIEKNRANEKHFYDGYYWTYNSMKAFSELFPYMTERQIDYAIKKLVESGLVIKGNYNKSSYDRTCWYAITKAGYSILQNCEMDKTNKEYSISQNCEMDKTNLSNGNDTIVKPIPDINTDSKQINEEKENYKEKENEFSLQKNISISTKKRNEKNQEYELIELKRVKEKVEHVTENVSLKNKILSFLNFRIKNKKLVTMEYLRVFLEKLDKLSNSNDNEKIEILNQSIERGYTTIYAVRKSGNSSFYRNNNIDEPESYNVDEYEKLTSNECYLDNMMNLL